MKRKMTSRVLLLVVLGACGLLLSGCWLQPGPTTFALHVVPASIADLAQNAATSFLVSVDEETPSALPATLTVDTSAGMAMVSSTTIRASEVVEITLDATGTPVGTVILVAVEARRGDEVHGVTVEATVTDPVETPDDRLETGMEMRDAFLPWIIAQHPELGIAADTVWTPRPLRPHILEVSFYMFQSEEWELAVWWHVMIPPYDWTRTYLRHRFTETTPSFGAEIRSRAAGDEPRTTLPPDEVWR